MKRTLDNLPPGTPRLWTYQQGADYSNVTAKTVQNWIRARRISVIRLGRVCRLDPEKFKAELRKFEVKAT
jgi:excisionase family DNA binding protein